MKSFNLEANIEESDFTYDNCDMAYTGPTGRQGEYRLRSTGIAATTSHCMAEYYRPIFSRRYKIEVQIRHDEATLVNGKEQSHLGLFFNYENKNNFVHLIFRYSVNILGHVRN